MADWWEAGGSIPSANCKEHVENPTRGQAYAGGSITGAWTVAVRALLVNIGGQQGIFDSTTGRMFIGWASGTQRGWYNGTWQNLDLFPLNQEVVVFIVSNGTTIQSYSDGVAVGSAIAATQDISGTTRWRATYDNAGSFWKASVPAGAVYDIALDATQRDKLLYQMRIIEPIRTAAVYGSSTTFNAPADVVEVVAEAWGGGGGGSTKNTNEPGRGSGGGGGGYGRSLVPVTPGNNYTVTVGGGGARGNTSTGANGSAGGASSFVGDGGVSAVGGAGPGGQMNAATGGGTGNTGNQATYNGGGGAAGSTTTGGTGSGGGGGAGDQGAGGGSGYGTAGAGGIIGGGAGGAGGPAGNNTNGGAGNVPGGGGGGAGGYVSFVNEQRNGGNGAGGRVILTWGFAFPLLPSGSRQVVERGAGRGVLRGAR